MKYSFFFGCLLCCFSAYSQGYPLNLDFEKKGPVSNDIFPWTKSAFTKKQYKVGLDSAVTHSGHYAVRLAFDTSKQANSDGAVFNSFPLDVIGSKITASAYFKQANPLDTAVLFSIVVSSDRGEKKTAVRGVAVTGAGDWKRYSFDITIDTFKFPIHHIRMNILGKTKDAVWMDDFKIELDGKELNSIPSLGSSKGEKVTKLITQQVSNLEILARVWGFLKYYHPAVASGKYSWDMELYKKIPVVQNAMSNEQVSSIIEQWIQELGEIPFCKDCLSAPAKDDYTANIDLKWMESKVFSEGVRQQLKYIFQNRHMGDGYYAKYEPVKNLSFNNENEYNWREKDYPAEWLRIQFLFRYWNTIQYFFPYKDVIGKDWNNVLNESIPKFAEAKDSIEYHVALVTLVNSVNDSHSAMIDNVLAKEYALRFLPVQIKIIDDQGVVSGFYNDSIATLADLKIGDIITHINNKSIKEIIDERIHLVNGSNYTRRVLSLASFNYITGGKDSLVQLTYIRDDKNLNNQVKRYIFSEFKWVSKADKTKWKILDNNIGYVHMGNLEYREVDSMMLELRHTKAIIFDIRNYPRGTYGRISEYLNKKRVTFAKITYPNLDYPGNFKFTKNELKVGSTLFAKDVFHFKGKPIILVNEYTQSHAEWTTMAFQTAEGAITIGSQTSGADGNVSTLNLTGNNITSMTGLGVFYPDGTPTQRIGVKVDVIVRPTAKGIRDGRDEVLEKALSIIK